MNEFFIAKRYLKAKHKIGFITILSAISWVGITIGVAALIIVISVFNGFGGLVKNLLISYDPHIIISTQQAGNTEKRINSLLSENHEVKSISPVLEAKGIANSGNNFNVVVIKGLNLPTLNSLGFIKQKNRTENKFADIFIGQILAAKMGLIEGDTISLTSIKTIKQSIVDFTSLPIVYKGIVKNIFTTNNKEYDENYIFTSLESAEIIFGGRFRINSFEIRLGNIEALNAIKSRLQKELGNNVKITTWYELHKNLYDVMQIERWSAFLLLTMIISVAVFNILSTLTMIVIEKKRDIGVLMAMGFNKKSIIRLFIYQGILVGTGGIFSGLILGLLTCYLQIRYKFYSLDPTKYIIDALPVKVELFDILSIVLATLFLASLASVYPAKKASEINIVESIKYE
jgi:lipoprotein-releasing system permease protein